MLQKKRWTKEQVIFDCAVPKDLNQGFTCSSGDIHRATTSLGIWTPLFVYTMRAIDTMKKFSGDRPTRGFE
jgi:hypothetical protein